MADKRETFPADAEEARLDVELTRQELGETAEALANKMKETAATTQKVALSTGAAVGAVVLAVVLIRKFAGR
ncbi:DUF3618 domain-containing protein [Amycolatopsis sp. K13G38]|uniref:DUF3618 domain-containing protein n=1 Tax=Amycolatopsis acididurans TaxID=2724524 RepID=A0ABX1JCF4_9PSEU|nr:DUF3618 domain-containing protein [Amycolatopsis acididurans]NKQ57154.1 DUF3618 domain-containing protein [Amycolatopsis acididurans]